MSDFFEDKLLLNNLLIGILVGIYVAFFYILNNLTMMPLESIVSLGLIAIVPSVLLSFITYILLRDMKKVGFIPAFSVGISTMYLLLALHPALSEINFINSLLNLSGGSYGRLLAYVSYAVILSTLIGYIFKKDIKKFPVVLGAMIVAVFVMNLGGATASIKSDGGQSWENWEKYSEIRLKDKPNIYLVVADSYGSFSFMRLFGWGCGCRGKRGSKFRGRGGRGGGCGRDGG